MMSSNGVLDQYLIAQALGWDWNFWTMLTLTGIEILIFIGIVSLCIVLNAYFER
jgi:hypothetical protein